MGNLSHFGGPLEYILSAPIHWHLHSKNWFKPFLDVTHFIFVWFTQNKSIKTYTSTFNWDNIIVSPRHSRTQKQWVSFELGPLIAHVRGNTLPPSVFSRSSLLPSSRSRTSSVDAAARYYCVQTPIAGFVVFIELAVNGPWNRAGFTVSEVKSDIAGWLAKIQEGE